MAVLSMRDGERRRLAVWRDVDRGGLPVRAAAPLLGRAERRGWRRLQAFRSAGAAGLIAKPRGRPSNRRTAAVRAAALWVGRHNCADFGPALAAEKLAAEPGFLVSSETLRKGMMADGRWLDRQQRRRSRGRSARALANWGRSTAASIGGARPAGRNAPCWCLATTRPAG